MKTSLKNRIVAPVIGLSLLALTAGGCGTLIGATVGGGTGAAIGAATGGGHGRIAKYGAIGAGVGGAAGLAYDVWDYRRDNRNRD